MKAASDALKALLETGTFTCADLYMITPAGGSPLRYATSDFDVNWTGDDNYPAAYFPRGPSTVSFDSNGRRAQAHWKRGLDVDQWQVTAFPRQVDPFTGTPYPDTIGTLPWLQAVRAGILKMADFIVDRAYFPGVPTYPLAGGSAKPTGIVRLFHGYIGQAQPSRSQCEITANDYRLLLSTLMPQNLWQAGCWKTLFSTACRLNADDFVQGAAALNGSNAGQLLTNLSSPVNPPSPFVTLEFSVNQVGRTFDYTIPVYSFVPNGSGGAIFLTDTPTYPDGSGNDIPAIAPGVGFTVTAANGSTQSSTMQAGSANSLIATTLSAPSQNAGFSLGRLQMTSGKNAGLTRMIRLHTPGSPSILTPIAPFPAPINEGDTFLVWPGCSRTPDGCSAFDNFVNFGGTPFIPAPESAV